MKVSGPIVIGGIGGSGTRLVASIMQALRVFIGNDIIFTLDNITYTHLFKRPRWYYRNRNNPGQVETGIRILEKSMTNNKSYTPGEFLFLLKATIEMARYGHNIEKDGTGKWAFQRMRKILFNRQEELNAYNGWGWKEANSHLIVKDLFRFFPEIKYIHTVRHGLDLAYSTTQQQLYIWGPMFGVPVPENKDHEPQASFRYWVEVNRRALELQNELGSDKFLILNFDDLCENPETMVTELIKFTGIKAAPDQIQNAIGIPRIPDTRGRFKAHDISEFKPDDLDFLESMGFKYKE
jgi:hypothetical protein